MFKIKNERKDEIMETLQKTCLLFTIIGAIVWGLIGFFQFDLVASIFGDMSVFSRIIYSVIGISGLYAISFLFRNKSNK